MICYCIIGGHKVTDVSIVLATLDRAKQLKNMLCSLKRATEGISYELIVIDGGSSDNTLAVIDEFSPIKAQIYSQVECLGAGHHAWPKLLNFGFSKTVGKWIHFASDDTVFHQGCISNAVLELNKQKDDVVGGIFFYKDIPVKRALLKDFHINYVFGQFLSPDFALIRSKCFKKSGGFCTSYDWYYAGMDLWVQWYIKDDFRFIPLPKCFIEHIWKGDATRISHDKTESADKKFFKHKWRNFFNVNVPLSVIKPEDL